MTSFLQQLLVICNELAKPFTLMFLQNWCFTNLCNTIQTLKCITNSSPAILDVQGRSETRVLSLKVKPWRKRLATWLGTSCVTSFVSFLKFACLLKCYCRDGGKVRHITLCRHSALSLFCSLILFIIFVHQGYVCVGSALALSVGGWCVFFGVWKCV